MLTRRAFVTTLLGSTLIHHVAPALAQTKGGVLNVATIGEPPTLDAMSSTADLVGIISQHIFETLFTFDAEWKVTPLLADSMPDVSADGRAYTIKLRSGVHFHDGSTMSSADVVASLERWTRTATRGKASAPNIEKIEALDPTTIRISLKAPYSPLLALLAFNNAAAIVTPASKQESPLQAMIGTGPYALKERKPDQYIQLVRFADYASRAGEPDGYGGARKQYVDEIRFVPLPDANTRLEGALSGQYDFVGNMPVEALDRLKDQPKAKSVLLKPFGWVVMVFNTRKGLGTNQDIRIAARTALNMEDMLTAAFGSTDFYALNGGMYPSTYGWATDAGVEGTYNLADAEKAGALLKTAGYDGSPLRILTSRQYEFHYKLAQVGVEYLKAAGFTVDLQVVDWATLTQRRTNPDLWDIYISDSPFLPEPALIGQMDSTGPGGWNTPARNAAIGAFNSELDPQKRVALWAKVQEVILAECPFIKIGDYNALAAQSPRLQGVPPAPWPYFWNAYLAG